MYQSWERSLRHHSYTSVEEGKENKVELFAAFRMSVRLKHVFLECLRATDLWNELSRTLTYCLGLV
jgi:hypothetical protein